MKRIMSETPLAMNVCKETRQAAGRSSWPSPLLEEHAGTFFVSTFSFGKASAREACGRDARELVSRIAARLRELEPGINGKCLPQITVTFNETSGPSKRTVAGIEMDVRTERLTGPDISELFNVIGQILQK